MTASDQSSGLRGQSAGQTALCSVGHDKVGLSYRGYDIAELAEQATFEEVAFLLLQGKLPSASELDHFTAQLIRQRNLPQILKETIERIPADSNPMDVLRTGCSMLGILEPETSFEQQFNIANRLLAALPSMMVYWYRYSHDGVRIETQTDDNSIAGHLLHLLHDTTPDSLSQRAMDVSLILYSEHEFNASTFTARVCASTLSDFYSAVCGAIGSLRGPLHGGANEAAMALISQYATPAEATKGIMGKLQHRQKIMGFGHAVYKTSDPRNPIIKQWSKKLSSQASNEKIFAISEAIEQLMWSEKKLFANLDFYSASTYHFLDIPTCLFTPIFVCSRMAGWAGHIFEQRENNTLIRPTADYIGPGHRHFEPIAQRS